MNETAAASNSIFLAYSPYEDKKKTIMAALLKFGLKPVINMDQNHVQTAMPQLMKAHPGIKAAVVVLYADQFFFPKDGKPVNALTSARAEPCL
jgi:hypothetical protein